MVSDAAMEKFEDHVRQQAEPVHAEDLVPVSRDDPRIAGPGFGNGETLPKVPVRRRVIPAPFRRPSIHIDHHGKSWQVRLAEQVRPGDIVPGVGRVKTAETRTRYEPMSAVLRPEDLEFHELSPDKQVAIGVEIVLTGIDGCVRIYGSREQVRVFTRREGAAAGASASS
jgi:hypothetical protein